MRVPQLSRGANQVWLRRFTNNGADSLAGAFFAFPSEQFAHHDHDKK
jgi:hypothetical protein